MTPTPQSYPPGDGTLDPGWMAPLALLSRAYACFLLSAGEGEVYEQQVWYLPA